MATPARNAWFDPKNVMHGWYFRDEEISSALAGDRLLNVSIDLSNPCNLNCHYCFIEEKSSTRKIRHPDEMTIPETLAVLEDFARAGAKTVNIVGGGEPTIDRAFSEVVSTIAGHGMVPVVFTNGIRLAEEHDCSLVKFLHDKNATVVLKYNSEDAAVQDLVAGRPGYTANRDKALDRLKDYCFNAEVPTRLALDIIAFKGNLAELPTIHRMCRAEGIFPILADFIPTGRTDNGDLQDNGSLAALAPSSRILAQRTLRPLSPQERADLVRELAEIDLREFQIAREAIPAYYGGAICTQLLGLYVDIRGNIWPCVARSRRTASGALAAGFLGNVRAGDKPSEIWRTHEYMDRLRKEFTGACPYKPELVPLETVRLVQNRRSNDVTLPH